MPLAPAGTIRLLDGVERRLQGGRSLEGTTDALLGAGRWLLVIVGAVLPWAAVLLVLYGVYRAVRRFRRRS